MNPALRLLMHVKLDRIERTPAERAAREKAGPWGVFCKVLR
jgi:hypothetical protein